MKFIFYKYEGTGNDFILIDNRIKLFPQDNIKFIAKLCHRRFGIGADGLMLLQNHKDYDFEMVYFNSDGRQSSMCGNGGRCITAFAGMLGIIKEYARFIAIDGAHEAVVVDIESIEKNVRIVKLKMQDVKHIEQYSDYLFMDTGSPHYVKYQKDIGNLDIIGEARKIRYDEKFGEQGTNVNFIEKDEDTGAILIRTYERGVEGETLSCGTGSTAAALAADYTGLVTSNNPCSIQTLGGTLAVYFEKSGNGYVNIWLEGPATYVFKGEIDA